MDFKTKVGRWEALGSLKFEVRSLKFEVWSLEFEERLVVVGSGTAAGKS